MKLRDLPEGQDISCVRLKVPAKALKAFMAFGGGRPLMYPVGQCMGLGFMLSDKPPTKERRRLYPLPPSIPHTDLLDWTIAQTPY